MSIPDSLLQADGSQAMTDWSPSSSFQPGVYRDSVLTRFPQPVTQIAWQDRWDFARDKTSVVAGETTTDVSANGVEITIRGRIPVVEGDLITALEQIRTMRTAVDVLGTGNGYDLYLHFDETTGTYRSFRSCITDLAEFEISDSGQFEYHFRIHADNPTLFTTAPA